MSKIKKTIALLSLLASLGLVPLAHAQFGCLPAPDLSITSISVAATSFKHAKEITVTVANAAPSGPSCVGGPSTRTQLLITAETDLLVGQTPIYTVPALQLGESYTVKRTIFKNDYAAYSSSFTAAVDPLNVVAEAYGTGESNNVKKLTLSGPLFAQEGPDGTTNMASVLSSMQQILSQMFQSLGGQ